MAPSCLFPADPMPWHYPGSQPLGCAVTDKLRFVDQQRGRDGATRHWYVRRNGRRWRLPGDPYTDAAAATEYWRLHSEVNEAAPSVRHSRGSGSFGALVRDYLASATFKE